MIRKTVDNVQDALKGVKDGMTLMLGGFGLCGIPENAISELVRLRVSGLYCISNNAKVSMISDWDYFYKINRLKR